MSTLRTRIGGYLVEIKPATQEQIDSHFATSMANGWARADYSRAVTASFVPESVDGKRVTFMDLPYELRSTIMTVNPEVVLDVMAQHVDELRERVLDAAQFCECFRDAKTCDNCKIDTALMSRLHGVARGNAWKYAACSKYSGRDLY